MLTSSDECGQSRRDCFTVRSFNAANEIDYAKAVGAFGVLYASFTAFFKMNQPGESK